MTKSELDANSLAILEQTVRLFEAQNQNTLKEQIDKDKSHLTQEFVKEMLEVIQQNTTTGNVDVAFNLLYITNEVMTSQKFENLYPYLYNQYALYYLYTNNHQKAKTYIKKALELPHDDATSEVLKVNLGLVYFRSGEYKRAIEFYESMLSSGIIKDAKNTNSLKLNLSICYGEMGDFVKTEQILLELLKSGVKDENFLSQIYGNLSNHYGHIGRSDKERKYLLLSSRLSKNTNERNWHTILNNYLNLCFFYQKTEELKKADYYLEVFKKYALQINTLSYQVSYARVKIKMLTLQGRLEDAEAIADKMQKAFQKEDLKDYEYLSFLGVSGIVKLHLQKLDEAKEYFELLNSLAMQTNHNEFVHVSLGYLGVCQFFTLDVKNGLENIKNCFNYEADLRQNIQERLDQFYFSKDRSNMYQTVLETLIVNGDATLLFDILQHVKSSGITSCLDKVLSFKEFHAKLPKNSVYVDYYIKDKVCFCLVVSADEKEPVFIKLDIDEESLNKVVLNYQASLEDAKTTILDNPFEFLEEISKPLLEPLKSYIKTKDIIIFSRSASLNSLPMQILKLEERFLIEHIAISYTLHASLIFDTAKYIDMEIVVAYDDEDSEASKTNMIKECQKVNDIASKHYSVKALINDDNSYEYIAKNSFEILHLINHGSFFSDPLKSGFNLKQDAKEISVTLDGLFSSKLLNAKFIFMSGCYTAGTHSIKGEEVLGIISYLHSHQTKTAILSSWDILAEIDETVNIIEDFYTFWLDEKHPKAIALQKAILKNSQSQNPYDWAGYVMFGECF
jgi:CHAT domain-containing protein